MATLERLTWKEIERRYPHQNVGLIDCQPNSNQIESAIVKYTEQDVSYDEMIEKAFSGEITMVFTTPDKCWVLSQ